MDYNKLSDSKKKTLIKQAYECDNKSFKDIADKYHTYPNKIRRDAIKYGIKIKDKSAAQKNALKTGKATHPTKGIKRSDNIKNKIGLSVMKSWQKIDEETLQNRKNKAKCNWENLDDDIKINILKEANAAVRESSKKGSKLERFILSCLIKDGYKVDFHKEQSLLNTKLQIDLFLPGLNIAIEIDGPSHFKPVWGQENLKKNKAYDNKKTGLILGKGLVLIRIKQTKDFSKARAQIIYSSLKTYIDIIQNKFPNKDNRNIEIGDE